jgi:hypothetical protein
VFLGSLIFFSLAVAILCLLSTDITYTYKITYADIIS